MPRPSDSPDVAASKTLSYILRHGAEKERLPIRSDGFVSLDDILARPKMRDVDLITVLRLVSENAKQRFELLYGYDPSPPLPKARQKTKRPHRTPRGQEGEMGMDVAAIDGVRNDLQNGDDEKPVELPLVTLPFPAADEEGTSSEDAEGKENRKAREKGEYFIRATQGHSIKLESTAHLEPVQDDEHGRQRVGLMVHGTRWDLWDRLREEGLSRMSRQHIHLAPALDDHRITPRTSSTLLIYLDLGKMLAGGLRVYTSLNGVVLTPGDERGVVPREMWRKAERVIQGERVLVWEDGKEVLRLADRTTSALGTG